MVDLISFGGVSIAVYDYVAISTVLLKDSNFWLEE